jgi:hypothetical protein
MLGVFQLAFAGVGLCAAAATAAFLRAGRNADAAAHPEQVLEAAMLAGLHAETTQHEQTTTTTTNRNSNINSNNSTEAASVPDMDALGSSDECEDEAQLEAELRKRPPGPDAPA